MKRASFLSVCVHKCTCPCPSIGPVVVSKKHPQTHAYPPKESGHHFLKALGVTTRKSNFRVTDGTPRYVPLTSWVSSRDGR